MNTMRLEAAGTLLRLATERIRQPDGDERPADAPSTVAAAESPGGGRDGPQTGLGRAALRWLTIGGPAVYLSLLAVTVLYTHPHPLPPVWPAFFVFLAVSLAGTFFFSRFVFAHVQRQEEEILRRTRELAEMNEAMAVGQERQRLARELHDSVAQSLGYLHLTLAAVEGRVAEGRAEGLRAELADLKQAARDAYDEARQAIFGLRGMVSRRLGLVPTLTEYLHDWSRRTGIAVDLRAGAAEAVTLSPAAEVQLIGIVQEAMANVRKHAHASSVVVRVESGTRWARLSFEDDGVGFDPDERRESFGLAMMRERAETADGTLTIASRPGHGTRVTVEFPLDLRRQP